MHASSQGMHHHQVYIIVHRRATSHHGMHVHHSVCIIDHRSATTSQLASSCNNFTLHRTLIHTLIHLYTTVHTLVHHCLYIPLYIKIYHYMYCTSCSHITYCSHVTVYTLLVHTIVHLLVHLLYIQTNHTCTHKHIIVQHTLCSR